MSDLQTTPTVYNTVRPPIGSTNIAPVSALVNILGLDRSASRSTCSQRCELWRSLGSLVTPGFVRVERRKLRPQYKLYTWCEIDLNRLSGGQNFFDITSIAKSENRRGERFEASEVMILRRVSLFKLKIAGRFPCARTRQHAND